MNIPRRCLNYFNNGPSVTGAYYTSAQPTNYHSTDDRGFYQLLTVSADVDPLKKLSQWEEYYNFHRPHGAQRGQSLL